MQAVISSVVKGIIGRGVRRAGKRCMDKIVLFPLHPVSRLLIISIMNLDLMAFFQKKITQKKRYNVINVIDKNSKGTHWISLFINKNTAGYSDSFEIEYISQEVLIKIRNKSITHNIFRIQHN